MFKLENKLFELSIACQQNNDKYAKWVMYAIERYITTGRSSRDFEKKFCNLKFEDMQRLINYCLGDRDLSDDSIIKNAKKFLEKKG